MAAELIVELAGARWVGHTDAQGQLPERPVIEVRPAQAPRSSGSKSHPTSRRRSCAAPSFEVADGTVTVPTWRARDVTREIDVVEEVARFRLDEVPFTLPLRRHMTGALTHAQRLRRRIEDALVGAGFSEAYTPTLVPRTVEPNGIRLPEPMTEEQAVLRTTLLPSLVEAAQRNLAAGNERIALFEIARVFQPADKLPDERERLGPGSSRAASRAAKGAVETIYEAIGATAEFERAAEDFLHPGKAATNGATAGSESSTQRSLEGAWGAFELDLESAGRPSCGRSAVRGRHHLPAREAGPRVRRSPRTSRPASSRRQRARRCRSCAR